MPSGRVMNNQVVAAIAIDELRCLEVVDGGDGSNVPGFQVMERFTRTLKTDESPHANRRLDAPDDRGYTPSHDIRRS
ncbi:MAG: hypothetical protein WCV93_02030 [Candidatus Shapirobacteria bacterium]